MTNENKKTSGARESAPIYVTEFENQFGAWIVFHAFRNRAKAFQDAGTRGRVIKTVEASALEAAQKRILECETEMRRLRNAAYHGLLEATAFMGIPEWKRENFIANQMSNFDFILDMAMKPGESTKFQLALSQTSVEKGRAV